MNQDQEQKLQISAECKLVIIWYYFDLELIHPKLNILEPYNNIAVHTGGSSLLAALWMVSKVTVMYNRLHQGTVNINDLYGQRMINTAR